MRGFSQRKTITSVLKNDMKANAVVRQASLDMSAKFESMHNWTCQQGLKQDIKSELTMDLHH